MRSRIVYLVAVGCLLLGVSFGQGQGSGGPSGNIINNSVFVNKMGVMTVIWPVGTCTVNANTLDPPRVSFEYGSIDAQGKQVMIKTNQPTTLKKDADGKYTWSAPDLNPIAPGTKYYVKASLYGRKKEMLPGKEEYLASNEVILQP